MSKTAEIIAVGTELLLGNTTNTNAKDLSVGLSALGINVFYHTVVGDNPDRLEKAIEIAKTRADILITTGGLGPTYDDMTKETVARAFGLPLVYHDGVGQQICSYFSARQPNAPMPQNNMRQAYLPEGCTILPNDCGTAPGCAFFADEKHVILLPGPPRECNTMFQTYAVPYLKQLSDAEIFSKTIHIFGMGESAVEEKLQGQMQRLTNPSLAPYAKTGEVMLRITAKAETHEKAEQMIAPVLEEVLQTLGDVVYDVDGESLERTVQQLLTTQQKTLATAESCTGGLLSSRITALPGASAVFQGGIIAYDNAVKVNQLGVPAERIASHGAVSEPVSRAMAEGARTLLGAYYGVGITGIAGPDGGSAEKPVGTVFVSLATPEKTTTRALQLGTDRMRIRVMAAHHALDMLRRDLTGLLR